MELKVKSIVNGNEVTLAGENGIYQGEQTAPVQELKTTDANAYYPVTVTAEDAAGNVTVNNDNTVRVENDFSFQIIAADPQGKELDFLNDAEVDVDIGTDNDFELTISMADYGENYAYGNRVFIPDTEYGGLIEDMNVITKNDEIKLNGYTWRGLLTQKVVEPPDGEDNLVLNGELNTVIRELVGDRFGDLFIVEDVNTGAVLKNWTTDRYATLYDTIMKFLEAYGYRLKIWYQQGERTEPGAVHLQAVPVVDYSEQLEYSQDANLDFNVRDYRRGINHLICAGGGEGTERTILHLYVQEDGSIGKTQFYTGLSERTAYYDYGNAEDEEKLEEGGMKRLTELQNYKKFEVSVDDIDLELGDIVGGREYITGTEVKKPVAGKIFNQKDGQVSIQYKLKGAD